MPYKLSQKILERYADVLVNFALHDGKGIKEGEVVRLLAGESAKPLYIEVRKTILRAGGHVISKYIPDDDFQYQPLRDFYELANEKQLKFFPKKYVRGLVEQIDHSIAIISERNKLVLEGIDPKKIMIATAAMKPFRDWLEKKEDKGKFTWTLGIYGTSEMARHAKLTLNEYWQEIIKGCYLDEEDPIKKWRQVQKKINTYRDKLNRLVIEKLHITGEDVNLWIKLGAQRKWVGCQGRNIPSFEIFTSPDWRGTNGWIRFDQPRYHNEHLIKNIELEFKNGRVIKYKASRNQQYLKEMIELPGADKVGEFSLTDGRFSRITKFMAECLFDENMGGSQGNTHIALGKSYHDCYKGELTKMTQKNWRKLGFNDSAIHADLVSTKKRQVKAYLSSGSTKIIYKDGKFTI